MGKVTRSTRLARLQALLAPWRHSGLHSTYTTLQVTDSEGTVGSRTVRTGARRCPESTRPSAAAGGQERSIRPQRPRPRPAFSPWVGTESANQKFLKHANKPPPPGKGVSLDLQLPSQTPHHPAQRSSPLARPEVETRAPHWRSRKCASEAHTGRKPSPGHAHLPVASQVYLRQLCSLTASPRRRPDHCGVQAEAEGRVGMAEGGSPEGRAGPRAAGNVSGVGW